MVGARDDIGEGRRGRRIFSLIENGRFDGARLRGEVLPGGADALLVDSHKRRRLDVRLVLRTNTGELAYMSYEGWFTAPADLQGAVFDPQTGPSVDPEKYYMRFCASFESGAANLDWLNGILAVGVGRRTATGPSYQVFELL
jgi:hypothetical protein